LDRRVLVFGSFVAVALLGVEGEAFAFCRTTTCKCTSDQRLPEGPSGLPRSTCGLPTGSCPRDEHGRKTTGTPVAWAGGCIGYSANLIGTSMLSDQEWTAAFREAFQAWQLVDCGGGAHPSIQIFPLRPTTCGKSEYNSDGPNVNAIYFTDNGWATAQTSSDLDAVIAVTKVHFGATGEIFDADIAINSARHDFTLTDRLGPDNYDLVSVLTHEVGHFLGLDHSDEPASVMYWKYAPGTLNRRLQQDDIDAICTTYPPERKTTCEPTPRGGLQDSCGSDPKVGCAAATRGSDDASPILPLTIGLLGIAAVRATAKRGAKR
jgi:hypothetical protein